MAKDKKNGGSAHYPAWYEAVQRHVFIPAIIAVGGIVYGTMFTWGLAPSGSWETWDTTTQVTVALMFAAGFLCGGMELRCSLKSATSFARGSVGFGLFNLIGVFLFMVPEMWAGIVERSTGFPMSGPDRIALEWFGYNPDTAVVVPSVLAIAILPPIVGLFYGFSEERREEEDPEEIRRRAELARVKLEAKQQLRAARVRGFVSLTRDTLEQVRESKDDAQPLEDGERLGEVTHAPYTLITGGAYSDKDGAPAQAGSRAKAPTSIPPGQWTAARFVEWVAKEYGHTLDQQTAKEAVKTIGKSRQATGAQGAPYVASITALKAWAKKQPWAASLALQA